MAPLSIRYLTAAKVEMSKLDNAANLLQMQYNMNFFKQIVQSKFTIISCN